MIHGLRMLMDAEDHTIIGRQYVEALDYRVFLAVARVSSLDSGVLDDRELIFVDKVRSPSPDR